MFAQVKHLILRLFFAREQYSVTSQFTTSKFTILADSRFHIYFLKTSNPQILKNHSKFTDFLQYMHNNDSVNWEENRRMFFIRYGISKNHTKVKTALNEVHTKQGLLVFTFLGCNIKWWWRENRYGNTNY